MRAAARQAPISARAVQRHSTLRNIEQHHFSRIFITKTKANARSTSCPYAYLSAPLLVATAHCPSHGTGASRPSDSVLPGHCRS
eukprot:12408285-Karenia_brevis.AAC.1